MTAPELSEEETMTAPELTREEVERCRAIFQCFSVDAEQATRLTSLCDMALRSLSQPASVPAQWRGKMKLWDDTGYMSMTQLLAIIGVLFGVLIGFLLGTTAILIVFFA